MILLEISELGANEMLKYGIISLIIAIIILLLGSLISTFKLLLKKDVKKYSFRPKIIKDVDEYLSLYDDEEPANEEKFDIFKCAKQMELSLKNSETVCIKKDDFYNDATSSVSYSEMKKMMDTGKIQVIDLDNEQEEITKVEDVLTRTTKIKSLVQPTIAHSVGPIDAQTFKPRQIVSPIFGKNKPKEEDYYTTQQLINAELSKAEEFLNGLKQLQESLK